MRHPSIASRVVVPAVFVTACAAGAACAQSAPKTLETLGLKIGQSADEVDSMTRSLGYVLQSKKAYPPQSGLPQRAAEAYYVRKSPQGDKLGSIGVGFGPMSGKAVVIAREETLEKPMPVAVMRAAMIEKYGPAVPDDLPRFEMHWTDLKDRSAAASPGKCWPAAYPVLDYHLDLQGRRHCRSGVEVLLGKGGLSFSTLKVSLVDFELYVSEWAAFSKLLQQEKSAEVEKVRPQPVPKI